MAFRNPLGGTSLGSPSALSLMSSLVTNPVALPVVLTAAGLALTVTAGVCAYKAFEHYEEKKHRKEIEAINRLWKKWLERINIPDNNDIQGFPIPFKIEPGKDASTAQSLHYNDDEVEALANKLPHGTDTALSPYREAVLNAILKLKEYYFARKDHNDITSGVLCYLLNMLQTHCLNFEGYEYDIAYLDAIASFIDEYASLEGRENSQHFTFLNPVYSYLREAQKYLENHRDKLSIEEMIGELRDTCISVNPQLIRSNLKLVTKNSDWPLIKTVTNDELSRGLLHREHVKVELIGLPLSKDPQKLISESVFKEWITGLSKFYLGTLRTGTNVIGKDIHPPMTIKDILTPEQMFKYPDLDRLNALRRAKKTTKEEAVNLHPN